MRCVIQVAALIGLLEFAAPARTGAADTADDAQAKSAIVAELRADRKQFHPGESIDLRGVLRNAGATEFKLAGIDSTRRYAFCQIHISTPNGEEFVFEPFADRPWARESALLSARGFTKKLAPAAELTAFQKGIRLADGLSGWNSHEHPHGPLSLRAVGEYRVWFEYRVPTVAGAPPEAWIGAVTSNALVVTVAELPAAERRDEPTAEQSAAIDKLQQAAPTSIEGRDLLQQAMIRAENEGLAERLVDLCLHDARRAGDFIPMIANRACEIDVEQGMNGPLLLGLDGPYLKTAALATIDAFENPPADPNHLRMFRSTDGVDIAIAYLRFHPEDRQARERFVKLARKNAPLPTPQRLGELRSPKPGQAIEAPSLSTVAAWQILLELGVLHSDMTVGEAIEILGPPSSRNEQTLSWYINTPRHVNPGLTATLKGDRVLSFQRYSG